MEERNITFRVMGDACAKGRPRFYHNGFFVKAYTDKKTASYENLVRLSYQIAGGTIFPLESALDVKIDIYKAIQKNTPKKAINLKLDGTIKVTSKPDVDNVAKAILDSLNGIAYHDDSCICNLSVSKRYALESYVDITIKEAD